MKKKIIGLILTAGTILTVTACRHSRKSPFADEETQPAGKQYYTTVNIWYEDPMEIYSTNYHSGTILPAGSKVTIRKVTPESIFFSREKTGADFLLIHVKRHTVLPIEEYFHRHFSSTDPMGEDSSFDEFTAQEQKAVRHGKIEPGISKDAVIMTYGYPPTHVTRTLDASTWKYWINRWDTLEVKFEDGKVTEVIH